MTSTEQRFAEEPGPIQSALRGADFWRRASGIYASYKFAQIRAAGLKMVGKSTEELKEQLWDPHHEWAGREMYHLCVDLRGFYLKAGQFMGARGDFIPEGVCRQLSKLHDQVPPMTPKRTEKLLKKELNVADLSEIFEEIDLEKPLGSASIAQVHKATLRAVSNDEAQRLSVGDKQGHQEYIVKEGEGAWDICNRFGVNMEQLKSVNKGLDLKKSLKADLVINLPIVEVLRGGKDGGSAADAAARAMLGKGKPKNGAVAVKVQYPDALKVMKEDLGNIRSWAAFLSKTEIQFDMVSAVDELQRQIQLEFDFTREARVMDSISQSLEDMSNRVVIPKSIPGLVTSKVLVMHFMDGVPLRELGSRVKNLSERRKALAKRRILSRISEAYGRMILGEGLFQADGHPGNILVQEGARIALLDYGQSKQIGEDRRAQFAELVLALEKDDEHAISVAMDKLGVVIETDDKEVRHRIAVSMFDTRGTINPFASDADIKDNPISKFPSDFFLVLRVVQLIRGLKQGMGVEDFSTAKQWKPYAKQTLRDLKV